MNIIAANSDSAYTILFDASHTALSSLWLIAIPLTIAAVLAAFLYVDADIPNDSLTEREQKNRGVAPFVIMLMLGAVSFVIIPIDFVQYWKLTKRMSSGADRVTTGVVANFMSVNNARGSGHESFTVNDLTFEYSSPVGTGGFNQTAPNGGPMHNGMHVRIEDVDGVIVRLEELRPPKNK